MNKTTIIIYTLVSVLSSFAEVSLQPKAPGTELPLKASFTDDHNQTQNLGQFLKSSGQVNILQFVYFNCGSICSPFLNETMHSIRVAHPEFQLGRDYQLWTISIHPKEKFPLSKTKKSSYLKEVNKHTPIDTSAWHFMTGDSLSIQQLTQALGFQFEAIDTLDYNHKAALIVLDSQQKISSYVQGPMIYPLEFKKAILMSQGGFFAQMKVFYYDFCFEQDSQQGQYVAVLLKQVLFFGLLALFICFPLLMIYRLYRRLSHEP